MAQPVAPTKSNLMRSRRSLRVAREGYDLLDRKRNVLIRELMALLDTARKARAEVDRVMAEAYGALQTASIRSGAHTVAEAAAECIAPTDLVIVEKSIMGAWVPELAPPPEAIAPRYPWRGTTAALDQAMRRFRHAASVVARAAAVENAVVRLTREIQRTRKRANALHNVLIPRYEEEVKVITEALEERDREEIFKVKVIKKRRLAGAK
jgi:V/A-type H+/Na+-transporting ATPase subunit D